MLLRSLRERCIGALLPGKGKEANAVVGGEVTAAGKEPQMEESAAQVAGRSEPRWDLSH